MKEENYSWTSWVEKLSEYEKEYTCSQDCRMSGCAGHVAKFRISHATNTYCIEFDGQDIYLDDNKMGLLVEFIEKASGKKLVHTKEYSMKEYNECSSCETEMGEEGQQHFCGDCAEELTEEACKDWYGLCERCAWRVKN